MVLVRIASQQTKSEFAELQAEQSHQPLSKATLYAVLSNLKRFFVWLAGQPGFKSKISYSDAEYFNLSAKDTRIAKSNRDPRTSTFEQIRHVLASMPNSTDLEKRDRALIAFTILTGARDEAVASLKLRHVDLIERCVEHDARDVRTKFSKSFTTWFFPPGKEIEAIVSDWIEFLRHEKLWSLDDPLFPAARVTVGESRRFESVGFDRKHWSNAGPIRDIFRRAVLNCGLRYHNPHSFRKTLALIGGKQCKTAEEYKSWSQNMGHESVLTTFSSYDEVSAHRQAELMRSLGV